MAFRTITPGKPFVRTAAHEAADRAEVANNLLTGLYREWPNEAGFDTTEEHRGPIELPVQGHIPAYAAGALFRTGPGVSTIADTPRGPFRVTHWFDGLAHSHKFDIVAPSPSSQDGGAVRVVYSSRRQAEQLMRHIRASGHHGRITFGQRCDPCVGIFGKLMSQFHKAPPMGENVCVAVHPNLRGLDPRHAARDDDDDHLSVVPSPPSSASWSAESSVPPSPLASSHGSSAASSNSSLAETFASGHRAAPPRVENLWLTSDNNILMKIDPATLEPLGPALQTALHPDLRGPLSAAHGMRDAATGDFFNFNLELGLTPTYRVFAVRNVGLTKSTTEILATITDAPAAYIHSFFLTARFVVLCVPVAHYGLNGLQIPWEQNLLNAIRPFDPAQTCKWYVVDRVGGQGVVARFETPAGFFFHSVNAYEELNGGQVEIVADCVHYDSLDIIHAFYYDHLMNRDGKADAFFTSHNRHETTLPSLVRFRFPLAASGGGGGRSPSKPPLLVKPDLCIPAPHIGDLPTINPAYAARKHRYVYSGAGRGVSTLVMDSIAKTDLRTRRVTYWTGPHGHVPGEAIFVARPREPQRAEQEQTEQAEQNDDDAEDDGVLLSVVLDGCARSSYLLCLDARTMRELGRAECGFEVPLGFHGVHV